LDLFLLPQYDCILLMVWGLWGCYVTRGVSRNFFGDGVWFLIFFGYFFKSKHDRLGFQKNRRVDPQTYSTLPRYASERNANRESDFCYYYKIAHKKRVTYRGVPRHFFWGKGVGPNLFSDIFSNYDRLGFQKMVGSLIPTPLYPVRNTWWRGWSDFCYDYKIVKVC